MRGWKGNTILNWRYVSESGAEYSLDEPLLRAPDDGSALRLDGPNDVSTLNLAFGDDTLARYDEILPVGDEWLVTLGAGMTPIVPGRLGRHLVWFKLDSLLPTGSFKDRGAALVVSYLAALDVGRVIVDSSGNAAASMAAYCAAFGIQCTVYAPASASPGKLVQSRAYGADVVLVGGSREDVSTAAQLAAEEDQSAVYSSHNWSPLFAEGVKTWALEVWEQLGGRSPDAVFVPTGGGSALMGAYRGFLATGGMPEIHAAQPAACAPIVAAFESDQDYATPVEPQTTVAEGAKIGNPARDKMILEALRDSSGGAHAVTEDQLVAALQDLWRQGIYAEPTAALGAAAFLQAVESGWQAPSRPAVVLVTGNGLKATDTIARLLEGQLNPG